MNNSLQEIIENSPKTENYGFKNETYKRYQKLLDQMNNDIDLQRYLKKENFYKNLQIFLSIFGLFLINPILFAIFDHALIPSILLIISIIIIFVGPTKIFKKIHPTIFEKGRMVEKSIIDLKQKTKEIVRDYEINSKKYWEQSLDEFKSNFLYRKKTTNEDFQNNLLTYSLIIEEVKNQSNLFLTSKINIMDHENYLRDRLSKIGIHNFRTQPRVNQESKDQFEKNQISNESLNSEAEKQEEEYIEPALIESNIPRVIENKTPMESRFRTARKINWENLFQQKMKTGLKGEEIIFRMEKDYLKSIGKNELAESMTHVSQEKGDGLGYDILSFFSDGRKKYIEVKTTSNQITSSYNISRNELSFLKENPDQSFIYRLSIQDESEPVLKITLARDFLNQKELIPISYQVK